MDPLDIITIQMCYQEQMQNILEQPKATLPDRLDAEHKQALMHVLQKFARPPEQRQQIEATVNELYRKYRRINSLKETNNYPTIGIDFGSSNCCIAVHHEDGEIEVVVNDIGETITPSYVSFQEDNEIVVGKTAKDTAGIYPKTTIFNLKGMLGRSYHDPLLPFRYWPFELVNNHGNIQIRIQDKCYRPEEIITELLKSLKIYTEDKLGEAILNVVVAVPVKFTDVQKCLLREAFHDAEMSVLDFVLEPVASALVCKPKQRTEPELSKAIQALVFDLGGGTLDVALVQINDSHIEVLATDGHGQMGGQDIDNILMDYCIATFERILKENKVLQEHDILFEKLNSQQLRRLRKECEIQKCFLATATVVHIRMDCFYQNEAMNVKLTRDKFNELIGERVSTCLQIVDHVLEPYKDIQVDLIVLAGGSARIPMIRERIFSKFPHANRSREDPGHIVAMGASYFANMQLKTRDWQHEIKYPETPTSANVMTAAPVDVPGNSFSNKDTTKNINPKDKNKLMAPEAYLARETKTANLEITKAVFHYIKRMRGFVSVKEFQDGAKLTEKHRCSLRESQQLIDITQTFANNATQAIQKQISKRFEKYTRLNELKRKHPHSPVVALYFGMTRCSLALYRNQRVEIIENKIGRTTTPANVALNAKENWNFGDVAETNNFPEQIVSDLKCMLGRNYKHPEIQFCKEIWPFTIVEDFDRVNVQVRGRNFSVHHLTRLLFKHLKENAEFYLKTTIVNIVLAVPAYFSDHQKYLLMKICEDADLSVIDVVLEPMAAMLACYNDQNFFSTKLKHCLVFDLDGRTLDVTLLEITGNDMYIIATDEDHFLDANELDQCIVDFCITEFTRKHNVSNLSPNTAFARSMERLKNVWTWKKQSQRGIVIQLDEFLNGLDLEVTLSQRVYNGLVETRIARYVKVIDRIVQNNGNVYLDEIVVVCQSSNSFATVAICSQLKHKFAEGKTKIIKVKDPQLAIARGTALFSSLWKNKNKKNVL